MRNLDDCRNDIDDINEKLLELFKQRLDVAKEIAKIKKQKNLSVLDQTRENLIAKKIHEKALKLGLDPTIMEKIIHQFISYTKDVMKREEKL